MEMISPSQYRENNKDRSIDELITLKKQLEEDIDNLSKNENDNSLFLSDTRLPMKKEYLNEISNLIEEKTNLSVDLPKKISNENYDLPIPEQEKNLEKLSQLLDMPTANVHLNSKRVSEVNATYYYNPTRGGKSIIVSDDGSYLATSSAMSFEKLLEEFNNGRRNGNFNENNNIKITCHSCGNEIEVDSSKLPKDIKTLDTMCPNCKSFIKYGNPNYQDNANDLSIIELSAIIKTGIPTKQHENTVLFISSDYAVVDNNRYDLSKTNKQEIDNLIKNNYSKLKKIFEEQTPEFLSNHIFYNNTSKTFNLKLSNEEMTISYQTGTESDNIIKKLIDDITSLVFSKINNSNDFKNIMDNIFSGLTGDNKKDFEYLNKKTEEYKNHPLSQEIAREIGRKLYDLLPDESKEQFNNAYSKDIDNINNMLKEVQQLIHGEQKDFEKAKNLLLDFVNGSLAYDNDSTTEYYNFDDVIDFALYTRLNKPEKNIKWIDIPFTTAYFYLAYIYNEEQNFDEALKMIDKAIRWAPMNLGPLFEKCATCIMKKDFKQLKSITDSLYDKIYKVSDLAHYYRNLGYYYVEMNNLNLAYALYSASIKFEKSNEAYREMAYINQQLNREKYDMPAEEGLNLLKENKIPFGPKQENLNRLTDLYTSEKELIKNPTVEMQLAERIYHLTLDKRFAPFFELVDKTTGCSIIIPRSWSPVKEEIKKEKFGNKCMFAVYTDNNSLFQAIYDGKCSKEQFNDAYTLNVNNIKNNKNINIKLLDEGTLTLKLQQGMKDFKHALFDMHIGDKTIRIIHYFTLINDIIVDFSINIDENIDYKDGNKFANQKNIRDMVNLLANIIELKNQNDTPKTNTKDDLINKIDNKLIDLTNNQLDEINITFKNNKEISKVFDFANDTFKNAKHSDLFWIESAKNTFSYILAKLLETNNKLNYDDIKEVLSNKNKFIDMCKNANTSLSNDKLIKIVENIKNSSDKMLDSYYDIILNEFKIINPTVETTTHNIKFNADLNFNIIFPKNLGALTHPNDTSFKVGNNVNIMNAKCNSEDLLKKRSNEWLENSAKTNNQTILSDLDKEYSLKNNQISVIEKAVTKDDKKRYYKFIYFNQTMLIFGYNNKELSKIIDDAIISLKLIKEQEKKQRDPFSKPSINSNHLKREEIVILNDEFRKNIEQYDSFEIPNNLYLEYFSKLENAFNSHSFEKDKRFVTYGRLDFLRKELTQRLNDESLKNKNPNFKNQWDNRLGAYLDLSDFIIGDRHISISNVPSGVNYQEILKLNDEYYKDGIICEQEKDILLLMIKEIKDAIDSGKHKISSDLDTKDKFVVQKGEFQQIDSNTLFNKKVELYDEFVEDEDTNIEQVIEFVESHSCDYSSNPISLDMLRNIEKQTNLKFGNQLTEYLTKYGYLGYKYIELYGINSNQELNSDMIKQTIYLHQNYERTNPYIVIENLGDNCYALIDPDDNVYSCDFNTIDNLHIKLFDYILKRFNEADNSNKNIKINNIKQIKFKITMSNWGMIGPNSITGNEFDIYDDLSIELKVSKNNSLGTEKEISILHGLISQEKYEEIISNIQKAKEFNSTVEAVDGNAWAFEEYDNGNLVWKRELGYIYGITPLTEITKILNSIDYK